MLRTLLNAETSSRGVSGLVEEEKGIASILVFGVKGANGAVWVGGELAAGEVGAVVHDDGGD